MSLVTATGDVTRPRGCSTAAQDIARFANVDLATAADAVAKAQAGQDGPLRKLIPGMEKGATATDTLAARHQESRRSGRHVRQNSAGDAGARVGDAFSELGETSALPSSRCSRQSSPSSFRSSSNLGCSSRNSSRCVIPLLKLMGKYLGVVAGVLGTVVGWLIKFVDWVSDAIGAIGRFLDSINPLKGITLPSLPFLSAAPSSSQAQGRGTRSAATRGAGSVVVNVQSADPEEVVRALRRWSAANGGAPALTRVLTRAAS